MGPYEGLTIAELGYAMAQAKFDHAWAEVAAIGVERSRRRLELLERDHVPETIRETERGILARRIRILEHFRATRQIATYYLAPFQRRPDCACSACTGAITDAL